MADKNLQRIDGILYVTLPDGRQMKYADFLAYNNPGMQFDDATGEPMAIAPPRADAPADTAPRREYQFGDVGSRMGNETLAAAGDTFANAGNVTRSMLPESVQAYVPPAASYLPDMALGGLLGVVGAGEKAIGYGSEAVDAGVRNAVEGLGFDWPYAPGTSARKLAGDVIGGLDAAGAAPEGRMVGAIVDAAGPAMRRGVVDRLNQPGPMPTTYSNPIPGLLSAPTDPAIQRAEEVLALIKSGRADEVTDAMLDMGDPVANARLNEYLFNSYDLPMDAVSRKARAEQMGFLSALHGTGSDFTAVDPAYFGNGKDLLGSGFYTSTNPSRADVYVPRERTPSIEVRKGYAEGGNVMPLSVREPRPFILEDVQGQSADDIAASFAQNPSFARSTTSSGVNYVTDVDGNRILLDPMQQKHYAVQNIRKEFGPSEVTTVLSDLGYSGVSGPEALGHRVRVAFDPVDVRSRFARFDPRLAHLKNLNASVAAALGLGGLLSLPQEEQY